MSAFDSSPILVITATCLKVLEKNVRSADHETKRNRGSGEENVALNFGSQNFLCQYIQGMFVGGGGGGIAFGTRTNIYLFCSLHDFHV